jgi:hypothetical protein
MAATPAPIGSNTVTAISRRYIIPRIVDNVYGSNVLLYRWNRMNKIAARGGFQIEVPLMYSHMAAGGWYSGYQLLNVDPTDSIQNAALAWKQAYVPVTVDGLTLLRADSPIAIVDFIATQFKQAEMELSDILGFGLYSNGSNLLTIDGLQEVVDTGLQQTSYAGISHASNAWWNSQLDTSATVQTTGRMNTMFGNTTSGGRSPTIIVTTQTGYNIFWQLNTSFNVSSTAATTGFAQQVFPASPTGRDVQLAQAGFENLIFNGTPLVVDSHVPSYGSGSAFFYLNEDYFELIVSERADFKLQDFQTPTNQDAMTALLLWAGNLTCGNIARQGVQTLVSG